MKKLSVFFFMVFWAFCPEVSAGSCGDYEGLVQSLTGLGSRYRHEASRYEDYHRLFNTTVAGLYSRSKAGDQKALRELERVVEPLAKNVDGSLTVVLETGWDLEIVEMEHLQVKGRCEKATEDYVEKRLRSMVDNLIHKYSELDDDIETVLSFIKSI